MGAKPSGISRNERTKRAIRVSGANNNANANPKTSSEETVPATNRRVFLSEIKMMGSLNARDVIVNTDKGLSLIWVC